MKLNQSGFSALEAIAAVAILAVALIPIASLQSQLARGYGRQLEEAARSSAVHNSISLMRSINPMQTPSGTHQMGQATMSWTSTPISPVQNSAQPAGFEVRLYRVEVEVSDRDVASSYSLDLIGWRVVTEDNNRRTTTE